MKELTMNFFTRHKNGHEDPVVEGLVRRIADDNGIDVRHDSRCADDLTDAVRAACSHARAMIDELGEPYVLDRKGAMGSALGPVLFDTRKDGLDALRSSSRLKAVFSDPDVRECDFLLTMHRHEYVVFGIELAGEMIKRDVMQDAVEFSDHNFAAAAPSLGELRDILTQNVVLFLADLAPERKRRDEEVRKQLHESEALLKAQLHTLDAALRQNRPFSAPTSLREKIEQGSREMAGLTHRLESLPQKLDPGQCLAQIRAILLEPQDHVRIERVEMRVGDFGVKSETGTFIRFHECVLADKERLAVFLASLDRDNAAYIWPELAGVGKED
jgi:hypothetical protein